MAALKNAEGVKLLLKVGDGADPENFSTFCSINAERGVQFQAEENTVVLPDCDDAEKIGWITSIITSLRVTASGGGLLHTLDLSKFFDWWKSGASKNCQLVMDVPAIDGGVIFQGPFKLPAFDVTGNRGEQVAASLNIASDGEVEKLANT